MSKTFSLNNKTRIRPLIALTPIAWATILLLQYILKIFQPLKYNNVQTLHAKTGTWEKMFGKVIQGGPHAEWLQPGLTIFIGIFISAVLSNLLYIENLNG